MMTFVTWKWKPHAGYRSEFAPDTVNVLKRMVDRHYQAPHRFICVTDDATGIDSSVEILPLWNDFAKVPSPHGGKNPSCYRRLRLFHPDAAQWFGERFVSMDLDVVITSDLRPLLDRPEPFVCWGNTHPTTHYNGSLMLLTAGARPKVWSEFDPHVSPQRAKDAGCFGSDQGWISYCLGAGEPRWGHKDGVYSYRNDLSPNGHAGKLPANARIVVFHGRWDPWSMHIQQDCPWVREHYR